MRFPGLILTLGLMVPGAVIAGPWLDPGDTGLRHDIELLADAGIFGGPVTVWPMSWGDLGRITIPANRKLTSAEAAAYARVQSRARAAQGTGRARLSGWLRGGSEGLDLRGFEDTPREQAEIGGAYEWTGKRFAMRLSAQAVADPEDDREVRGDGSYVGLALGNWMIAGAVTDRWWGPGWQSNMILSSNARPIPAFTIDRNSTAPFETKWLRWIGHWDFITLWGFLEHDRAVPDARYFGMRFTSRPARFLEIGISRTAMWCGEGRPCGWDTFVDLLTGKDNAGENVDPEDEPGNQLGGYDIRLNAAQWGVPVAAYIQRIGEDEQDFRPSLFLTQVGVQAWGGLDGWLGEGTSWRAFLEVSDTLCGGNITGEGTPNCAYNHPIYETGMRYRGRSIGHSADNDAEIWTLGAVLNDSHDASWVLTGSWGDLNREGSPDPANPLTPVKKEYRALNLVHRRTLPVGRLQLLAGVESFEDAATGASDDDWRVQLDWHYGY